MNDMSENNDGSIKPRSIPIRTNAGNYEFSEFSSIVEISFFGEGGIIIF